MKSNYKPPVHRKLSKFERFDIIVHRIAIATAQILLLLIATYDLESMV